MSDPVQGKESGEELYTHWPEGNVRYLKESLPPCFFKDTRGAETAQGTLCPKNYIHKQWKANSK